MGGDPGTIQDFLDFLRTSGIAEAQVAPFQRVAEQLLLAAGTSDLLAVTPGLATRWREALRERNPTEAQMVLISRGISALQAYQRARVNPLPPSAISAPPASHPSPTPGSRPPASPGSRPPINPAVARTTGSVLRAKPEGMSGGKKVAVVVALGAFVVAAVAYTIIASRQALLENRKDSEILTQRNDQRKIGVFYPSFIFLKQPEGSCQPAALTEVNKAVELSRKSRGEALRLLDDALAKDPACVGAARVRIILDGAFGTHGLEPLRDRFVGRADANPADSAAQLMAAFYVRQMGDGEGYRKYLERAEQANPAQPLLAGAWSAYWDLFAQPRDFQKMLDANRTELARSGDLGAASNLASIYAKIGDFERVAEMCAKLDAALPDDDDHGHATVCLQAALRNGDPQAQAKYVARYLKGNGEVSAACMHADLAAEYYNNSCRYDDALKEADLAIQQGCTVPGSGHRRDVLVALHRWEDAAEPPPDGRYWDGIWGEKERNAIAFPDRDHRALALAMLGRDQEALAILRPVAERDEFAQIMIGMIENDVLKGRVEHLPDCAVTTERSERLAEAAGGYVGYKLFDDAQKRLDEAFALNPKSPHGWGTKVYLLSLAGDLKGAQAAGEQALAMGIDEPTLAGNLGYVYQQEGECEKAIPLFKRKMLASPWRVANYTNLAKCLEADGHTREAATVWAYVQGGKPRVFWWMYAGILVAAVGLYLGAKLALIKLLPDRFGHLKFP